MKALAVLDRIRHIDLKIRMNTTGTPEELASELDISVSRLYDTIREMKAMGAPIKYSKNSKTYFYVQNVCLFCEIKWLKVREIEG